MTTEEKIRKHLDELDGVTQEIKERINKKFLNPELLKKPDFFDIINVKIDGNMLTVYRGLLFLIEEALVEYQETVIAAAAKGRAMVRSLT